MTVKARNTGVDFRVTVAARLVKNRYYGFSISIPTVIARTIGLRGGEEMCVRLVEAEIDRKKVRGILYYICTQT